MRVGVDRGLRVVGHDEAVLLLHEPRVGVGDRDLALAGLLERPAVALVPLHTLPELLQLVLDQGRGEEVALAGVVHLVDLGDDPHVLLDVAVAPPDAVVELVGGEVGRLGVVRAYLRAVDGGEAPLHPAGEPVVEGAEDVPQPRGVVASEVGDRAEVGLEALDEPHDLDVRAAGLREPA